MQWIEEVRPERAVICSDPRAALESSVNMKNYKGKVQKIGSDYVKVKTQTYRMYVCM